MTGFRPSPDFIPGDGIEPHVELSRDNPLTIPWIEDRNGVDLEHVYHAGGDCSNGLCIEPDCGQPAGTICTYALCPGKRGSASPFHATGVAR